MIARPKMSHVEWKTIELRRFKMLDVTHPFPPRRTTALDVKESSGVSAVGILLIIYGAFSLIFCLILGQFKEPPPPRKRK